MKEQTHSLTEIQGAIKAIQTEIVGHQPYNDTCREAGLWREVAIRSMRCAETMANMLQYRVTQNQALAQKSAHTWKTPYASPKK